MLKKIFSLSLLTISLLVFNSCDKINNDAWAVKIDNKKISIKEFLNFYYTQNKLLFGLEKNEDVDKMAKNASNLNPQFQQYLIKKMFLDNMIAQRLLLNKAMNDDSINKKELTTLIEISKLQTVSQYYLAKKLKKQIKITDQDIETYYNQNRRQFAGVPLNDAIVNKIKQMIFMQKSKIKSQEYIMTLLAESKVNKEGFKNYMSNLNKETIKKEENKQKNIKNK